MSEQRTTHQPFILCLSIGLIASSIIALSLVPAAKAGAGSLRGKVGAGTPGELPTNDDFHFHPTRMFVGSGEKPPACDIVDLFDTAIAIDLDVSVVSSYPGGEAPVDALDQDSNSKYLNFGREDTGLIATPVFGASTVQSIRFTTANDSSERDPLTFDLYGTNDAITSADNSGGQQENWTLITSGVTGLPEPRFTNGPVVDFANGASYTSYKIIFPTVRGNGNSMQVGDISLFTAPGGGGSQIFGSGDFAIAVADPAGESFYPGGEGADNAIDGTNAKYLNFGGTNSGLILSRADGQSVIVESFVVTSANDSEGRDPTSYAIWGTDDAVTSEDNSTGNNENWNFIGSGSVSLPSARNTLGAFVNTGNTTAYRAYRIVFPTQKNNNDSFQIAEIDFCGAIEAGCACNINGDMVVDVLDLLDFLSLWFVGDAGSDFNNDGSFATDVLDLLDFLSCWFPAQVDINDCP